MPQTDDFLTLAGDLAKTKDQRVIRDVRPLDEQEFSALSQAIAAVNRFDTHYSLYNICEGNYGELVNLDNELAEEFKQTHDMGYERAYLVAREMNRRMMNYLSGFRMFVDYYETRLKHLDRLGHDYFAGFHAATSACFDGCFAYRFFYKFRNYVQHCGLPLGGINATGAENPDGTLNTTVVFWLDRDSLLRDFDAWGAIVTPDLKTQPEHIAVLNHLHEVQACIQRISRYCVDVELNLVAEPLNLLTPVIAQVQAVYSTAIPVLVHTRHQDGKIHLEITDLPLSTIQRINDV